jgi:site-specific recombinase XerD
VKFINLKILQIMESLDIRFSFFLRSSYKNSNAENPIVFRIKFRYQTRDIFTGIYCPKTDWDSDTCRILKSHKKAIELNRNLDKILRKAGDAFDQLRFSGVPFSIDELVDKIKGKEARPELLMEFMEEGNKRMKRRVGVEITKATYYKYKKSAEYVQEYLLKTLKQKNYLLLRIDIDFLTNYFQYLRLEKNISHNSALKYMSFLKVILQPAIRNGIIKNDPFRDLKIKAKPVIREFLSQEEIKTIVELELDHEDQIRKRDIFLFACYTGLAYIDIQQLKREHILQDPDGSFYIIKPRQKTGQESIIPLLPAALNILKKYSLTGNPLDFRWYISTNQKMNLGLKLIGKKAGINKTLHMHLARHTFATTVTLANGVPIETVSRMLGHANLRQTQHYAKVVATKIKMDMEKVKKIYFE